MTLPRLGLAGHKGDKWGRTLQLREFLRPSFAYPAACDLTSGLVPDIDDLGNRDVGCCAIAGPGHFVRWEDQLCRRPVRVQAADVEREYSAISGYVPGDESTDVGCYALDVLKHWRKVGLFGTQIVAFAEVNVLDTEQIVKATFLFGDVFLCFRLPVSVQGKSTWEVEKNDGGEWGNHLVWSYGTNLCNSWGGSIWFSDAFRERRCFAAYAVVSADAILPGGRALSGLDLVGLGEALSDVIA